VATPNWPANAPAVRGKGLPSTDSYLKFSLSPFKGKSVRQATLTLTTASGGRVSSDKLIVCREVLAAWNPDTVHGATRDGTNKWAEADYGKALPDLYAEPLLGRKEWDATESVQRLLKAGESTLSLRVYGGPQDVVFADPDAPYGSVRPCLSVVLYGDGK
jgi:hypothetical protein